MSAFRTEAADLETLARELDAASHKNGDANAISQARAVRFGYQLHIQKRLPDSRLITLDQRVGLGIDTAHTGDEDEIARARANIPGSGCLDRALGRERFDAIGRGRLGEHDRCSSD